MAVSKKKVVSEWLPAIRRRIVGSLLPGTTRSIRISHNPYDRSVREDIARQLFDKYENAEPFGTIRRGRLLLKIIEEGFPTGPLVVAYFKNLEQLLKEREKRTRPGQLLLGLGSGRSGSTSLTSLLNGVENSCCTHENPPLIFWTPEREQVQFHIRRFELLLEHFSLVADVSHWWLNVLGSLFCHFPNSKAIGVYRDEDLCVQSFMRIKRYGRQSWNHWVPHGNGIWAAHSWDPTYPTYSIPGNSSNLDHIKYELIGRYVREYNAQLEIHAARFADKVVLVKTEELNEPAIQAKLFDFAGVTGHTSKHNLNVRSVTDGIRDDFKF